MQFEVMMRVAYKVLVSQAEQNMSDSPYLSTALIYQWVDARTGLHRIQLWLMAQGYFFHLLVKDKCTCMLQIPTKTAYVSV